MSESTSARSAEPRPDDPEPIRAVPLRHPGRWISGAIVLIALGLFAWGAATNEAYRWDIYARYLFDARITAAAWKTVQLTVLAMAIAVVLGVVLAVMRLSPNPVLRSVAWLYLWVFRGTRCTSNSCCGDCSRRSTSRSTSGSRSSTSSFTSTCRV